MRLIFSERLELLVVIFFVVGEIGFLVLIGYFSWGSIVFFIVRFLSLGSFFYISFGGSSFRILVGFFVLEKRIRGRLLG